MADTNKFSKWLISRDRTPGTARVYASHVKEALTYAGGPAERVRDRKLAPKTRVLAWAALRAWAKFQGDSKLSAALDDIRRPQAQRVKEEPPLARDVWHKLQKQIDKSKELEDPMRAVLGMLAHRGFRVGDVLRATREEVLEARRTSVLRIVIKRGKRGRFTTKRFAKYLDMLVAVRGWERVYELFAKKPASAAQAVRRALHTVAGEIGLDQDLIHPHLLRRTYASAYLAAAKGDLTKLKAHMQWDSIATAAAYTDYYEDTELDEIAERIN